MKQALKIVAISALATAALLKGVPALAEPVTELNVSVVRTADLDLNSEAGKRALDRRIANAAAEVCGSASDTDVAGKNDARQCLHDVIADARARSAALVASRAVHGSIVIAAR
ncbi:MAG TPA: UrcA family protein [Sphingomicrobium sp.]